MSGVVKHTGEVHDMEVFVGILPCSGYIFIEASRSQQREDFIGSINNCFQFLGCSSKAIGHKRVSRPGQYVTIKEHMSSTHQFYNDWSPEYFNKLALSIGQKTGEYISLMIAQQDYPETGYKQALGS